MSATSYGMMILTAFVVSVAPSLAAAALYSGGLRLSGRPLALLTSASSEKLFSFPTAIVLLATGSDFSGNRGIIVLPVVIAFGVQQLLKVGGDEWIAATGAAAATATKPKLGSSAVAAVGSTPSTPSKSPAAPSVEQRAASSSAVSSPHSAASSSNAVIGDTQPPAVRVGTLTSGVLASPTTALSQALAAASDGSKGSGSGSSSASGSAVASGGSHTAATVVGAGVGLTVETPTALQRAATPAPGGNPTSAGTATIDTVGVARRGTGNSFSPDSEAGTPHRSSLLLATPAAVTPLSAASAIGRDSDTGGGRKPFAAGGGGGSRGSHSLRRADSDSDYDDDDDDGRPLSGRGSASSRSARSAASDDSASSPSAAPAPLQYVLPFWEPTRLLVACSVCAIVLCAHGSIVWRARAVTDRQRRRCRRCCVVTMTSATPQSMTGTSSR